MTKGEVKEKKDYSKEGTFAAMPGAEKGKVVVRFPPEASGYLHIGHAKAALLNQFYQKEYEGKLIFRFDDTNPAKEKENYEKVIEGDMGLLGISWNQFTRTSDYFDLLEKYMVQMIKEGNAFADDTDQETMRAEREARQDSKNRNNSVEKNLEMWEEMRKASESGIKTCIRAKINMQSDNGTMRDPCMYRCKPESHLIHGFKYKVYPGYDFACPIVDSIENVTHALRTTEYTDRNEQYMWVLDALKLRKPYLTDFARFGLQNTVLSKRRLTWFVDSGRVTGWDDPRFPTVRGILRRGMAVEALKQFIIAQGFSRCVVQMEWDKIWAVNKKIIDDKAPRHTAVLKGETVPVTVSGQKEVESKQSAKHPKNADLGTKTVWYSQKVLIDQCDAQEIKENDMVTFMDWGNVKITKITKDKDGKKVLDIAGDLLLDNKDFKKTYKTTWLADVPEKAPLVPLKAFHFDHIIAKPVLDKEDDFKQYCEHQTEFKFDLLGDVNMRDLKKGDTIQLARRGYYIVDKEWNKDKPEEPIHLFNIPEGHQNESPTSYMSITNQVYPTRAFSKKFEAEKVAAAAAAPKKEAVVQFDVKRAEELSKKCGAAGEQVRSLKTAKAPKEEVEPAVKALLALKAEFKKMTLLDWKADIKLEAPKSANTGAVDVSSIKGEKEASDKVKEAGEKVRQLKNETEKAVKDLLAFKAAYKTLTGADWKA